MFCVFLPYNLASTEKIFNLLKDNGKIWYGLAMCFVIYMATYSNSHQYNSFGLSFYLRNVVLHYTVEFPVAKALTFFPIAWSALTFYLLAKESPQKWRMWVLYLFMIISVVPLPLVEQRYYIVALVMFLALNQAPLRLRIGFVSLCICLCRRHYFISSLRRSCFYRMVHLMNNSLQARLSAQLEQLLQGKVGDYVYWSLFGFFSIFLILPLWTITYLPLGDLPDHAAQLHAILNFSEYSADYKINWLTPYLVGYSISILFGAVFSAVTALKITYTLSVLAIPLATALLLNKLEANRYWVFPSFASAFSFSFYWGFSVTLLPRRWRSHFSPFLCWLWPLTAQL